MFYFFLTSFRITCPIIIASNRISESNYHGSARASNVSLRLPFQGPDYRGCFRRKGKCSIWDTRGFFGIPQEYNGTIILLVPLFDLLERTFHFPHHVD